MTAAINATPGLQRATQGEKQHVLVVEEKWQRVANYAPGMNKHMIAHACALGPAE